NLYQHLEYFPFGEAWVEDNSSTNWTPYLFADKQLDEGTDLYYFGARYYDPRTSVWQSADPAGSSFLGVGDGGAFRPANLQLFGYAHQNPIRFTDPTGLDPTPRGTVTQAREQKTCYLHSSVNAYQVALSKRNQPAGQVEAEGPALLEKGRVGLK